MQISEKRRGLFLLCAWFLSVNGAGQILVWKDTALLYNFANVAGPGISPVRFRLTGEMEYSLSGTTLLFLNGRQGDNIDVVSLFQHLKFHAQIISCRHVRFSNTFVHDLGIQYFFDSISRFHPDENTLDSRLEVGITKNLSFTVFSNLTTRMFNSWNYVPDPSGTVRRVLCGSFLTPLVWTFSIGLGLAFPGQGNLSLGVSAGKFTWIRNREVFNQPDIPEFYGVPREKSTLFEYGLSLHLLIDRDLLKRVHWNCDLLVFKNFRKPADLGLKNLIGIRINKFLKTSIQTRLNYEEEISKKIRVENLISLGFYINL